MSDTIKAAREALEPFARIAEHDIGEDEADIDLYRPMSARNARAPLLTVGDLRRARAALSALQTSPKDTEVGEAERFRDAIVTIIGRCEALEDEAADELATDLRDQQAGYWLGQKSTAKSLRNHLADMARPITPSHLTPTPEPQRIGEGSGSNE